MTRASSLLVLPTTLALLAAAACAEPPAPDAAWLPDDDGWRVREIDDAEPATWASYDRDALGVEADVKEIRVTGLVDAPPAVVADALRSRMLDPEWAVEGFDLQVLSSSETEVVTYGLAKVPWPLKDREVYERLVFSHDPASDTYWVDVDSFDAEEPIPDGVVRVPLVRNRLVVEPGPDGGSVLTTDSVHDMGPGIPNRSTYKPIRRGVIEVLFDVRAISAALEGNSL